MRSGLPLGKCGVGVAVASAGSCTLVGSSVSTRPCGPARCTLLGTDPIAFAAPGKPGEPFLLVPAGIAFVANAAADIAQVLSVKLRGRRVLKYAPLHHHFTRVGWPETWVVQRFWIAGAVGALVAIWASQW